MIFYDTKTIKKERTLIDKTWVMYNNNHTPEEIALNIGQPVEDVNNCISYCVIAYRK